MIRRSLALLVALAFLVGCASGATPARKAFTSIDDVVAAGTTAMKAFNERYQAGLQTESDRTLVLEAWKAFQAQIHFAESLAKDPNRQSDPVTLASDALAQLASLIARLKTGSPPTPSSWLLVPVGRLA